MRINLGTVALVASVVTEFIGEPVWLPWWVYILLFIFTFKEKSKQNAIPFITDEEMEAIKSRIEHP